MGQRGARIYAGAGLFDGGLADIGGENLERESSLLPHPGIPSGRWRWNKPLRPRRSRAPRSGSDPSGARFSTSAGNTVLLQFLEDRRFPKESGDGDKTALAQRGWLPRGSARDPGCSLPDCFETAEGHAALDAPRQRAVLVVREVHSRGVPHQAEDLGQVGIPGGSSASVRLDRRPELPARWPPVAGRFRPGAAQNPPHRRRWRCAACCRTWRFATS